MFQVGEDEVLLDDSIRFYEKARNAGVEATLHVWKGMFHCFPLLAPFFKEAVEEMDEISSFIDCCLKKRNDNEDRDEN